MATMFGVIDDGYMTQNLGSIAPVGCFGSTYEGLGD